ncbi:MAG TPA: protein translocase subunit SecD [Myxococcaceae bacterium]|nr:protein translocase subunit SecD [Myxococcaceae bacterium]
MDSAWRWKAALIVALTLGCLWLLVPTYYSVAVLPKDQRNNLKLLDEKLPPWAPPARFRLSLGLDLQGGIHTVMRVDTQTALRKRVERRATRIEQYLEEKKLPATAEARPQNLQIFVRPKDPSTLDAVSKEIDQFFGGEFTRVARENDGVLLALDDTSISYFQEEALEQAMIIIRNRVDKWGVAEADIRKRGTDAIELSLPGQEDPERVKELIGKTAQLEFKLVDEENTDFFQKLVAENPLPPGVTLNTAANGFPQLESADREVLLSYVEGKAPPGREVNLECDPDPVKKGECRLYRTWLLHDRAAVTGDSLSSADYAPGEFNEPEVNLTFDAQGARDFEQLTAANVGKRMAIVLDDTVTSAPRINERIPGGRARITIGRIGDEGIREAQNLALVLKAGALPAPVALGEIRHVGATLGPELIRKGSLAAGIGFLLVVAFMAFYYRKAGLIADAALIINGLLILACLAAFNATLTLPGIAGFVLTLGIAVDANVLINERIREELRHGKTARAAVDQGYDRAFWTIFDSHVTALIAGFVLLFTGTGPIRGFATTLVIGLIASLYTSIVVTRVIVTYFVHGRNAQTVSV